MDLFRDAADAGLGRILAYQRRTGSAGDGGGGGGRPAHRRTPVAVAEAGACAIDNTGCTRWWRARAVIYFLPAVIHARGNWRAAVQSPANAAIRRTPAAKQQRRRRPPARVRRREQRRVAGRR